MAYRDIEEGRAYGRDYQMRQGSTPEGRQKQADYLRQWTQNWRAAAMDILGGKCAHCGFADPRALQFDHVNGDGQKDVTRFDDTGRRRRKSMSLGTYYKRIAEQAEPGRFQLLCANCNWIKREEKGEHLAHLKKVV